MAAERPWLVSRRTGALLGILVVGSAVLFARWNDITLAYRLRSAQNALGRRDWSGAAAILARCEAYGRDSAQWHFVKACALRRSGQPSLAAQHVDRAQALGWNAADIDRQRLLIRAESGEIKQAEGDLADLLRLGVNDQAGEEIYEAMARGYLGSYHIAEATQCLKFWSEFQPANELPHLWMGDLYRTIENPEAAAAEYRRVLEIKPGNVEARLKLAQTLLGTLQVDEAAELFETCREQAPTNAEPLLGLAECRRRQGRTEEESASLLRDALVLDLTSDQTAQALAALGQLELEDHRYAPAIQMLQHSVALDSKIPTSRIALAGALAAVGEDQLAAAQRESARQLVEQHSHLVSVRRRIASDPANADLRYEVGVSLMDQGMWSAGAEWLLTAVAADPRHRAAHERLASYYERIGNRTLARRHQALAEKSAAPAARPQ